MVNSKFTPIAKVRKQQRDKVETSLAQARAKKQSLKKEISIIFEEINNTKMPVSGHISLISLVRERLVVLRREKDSLDERLKEQDELVKKFLVEYKLANIEFEKIKYLEEQDYEAWVEKIKKQEQLDMDEISTMLFANKE